MSYFKGMRAEKRVLISLVFSYLLVVLLPVGTWLITYRMSNDVIKEQTDALASNMLTLLREAADSSLNKTALNCFMLSTDAVLLKAVGRSDLSDYSLDAVALQEKLSHYKAQEPMIYEIFVYFPQQDYIISYDTMARTQTYYKTIYGIKETADSSYSGLSFAEWRDFIENAGAREYLYMKSGDAAGHIAYQLPVPMKAYNASSQAKLVVMFRSQLFTRLIEDINTLEDAQIFVFGSDRQLLAKGNGAPDYPQELEGYVRVAVKSESTGNEYVSLIPGQGYYRTALSLSRVIYLCSLGAVILCGGIIAYAVRKNYNPIKELVFHIERNLQKRSDGNVYEYLKDSFEHMMDLSDVNRRIAAEQSRMLRDNYVERLLLGHADMGVSMQEYFNLIGLNFISDIFAVILIDFDGSGAPGKLAGDEAALPGDFFDGYSMELEGRTVILADCGGMGQAQLLEKARSLSRWLARRYSGLVIAVSSLRTGAQGIAAAYDEALYTLHYALALGGEDMVAYDEIAGNAKSRYYYPPEDERALINAVTQGDSKAALAVAKRIYERNLYKGTMRLIHARLLAHNFAGSLLKAAETAFDWGALDAAFESQSLYTLSIHAVYELWPQISGAIEALCRSVSMSGPQEGGGALVKEITAYVEANYSDPDMTINSICEHFGRSRSGMFLLFKEETGDGLLSAINKARISAAKRLLEETDMPVNEIAKRVGYLNTSTLLRVFKRVEGISPSRHRSKEGS